MKKEINELVLEAIKDGAFPGACLCVVSNGKVHLESYGLKAKYPEEEENDVNTIYDMASCSKVISTTTSILVLLEQGKLRLYEPVCNILPEFGLKNVTVWDLITHTSGLIPGLPGAHQMTKQEIQQAKQTINEQNTKNKKLQDDTFSLREASGWPPYGQTAVLFSARWF